MRKFNKVTFNQFRLDFESFTSNVEEASKVYENLKKPKRATKYSSGYDIYSPISFSLQPGETIKIPTGFQVLMPETNFLLLLPRSGHGFKYFVRLANIVGNIDADYSGASNQGHLWLKIRNEGDQSFSLKEGEAMCQSIFLEYLLTDDDEQEEKAIRQGGFGSTDEL